MEYIPRFAQPFSLAETINLDVAVITEEIARLQNSLAHLQETQVILKSDLDESTEADPEVAKAFEENKSVIGSQEERISILKMALTEKGIVGGPHYDLPNAITSRSDSQALSTERTAPSHPLTSPETHSAASEETEDAGVYL